MRPRPFQNRVTATGRIIADPARGLFMGNRGILHDENGALGHALWRHKAWIICSLSWKGWHREIMQPGSYTELFFLDEVVAMAAGHRPCALCRRSALVAYKTAIGHTGSVSVLDAELHRERATPRRFEQRRHQDSFATLPDGTIILGDGAPALVLGDRLHGVTPGGYVSAIPRPKSGEAVVLTPETNVNALRGGYRPVLHHSIRQPVDFSSSDSHSSSAALNFSCR